MRDLDQIKNLPHVVGLCGWDNHHVYTWKKSKYQRILWYIYPCFFNLSVSLHFSFVRCWHVEFLLWAAVIYPSLLQLQKGITDTEDKKQKAVCMERYRRRDDEDYRQCSDIDIEREDECGICMDMNTKIVLPNCNHAMCLKCYREWYFIQQIISVSLLLYALRVLLQACRCIFIWLVSTTVWFCVL